MDAVKVGKSVSNRHHDSVWQGEAGGGIHILKDNRDGLGDIGGGGCTKILRYQRWAEQWRVYIRETLG